MKIEDFLKEVCNINPATLEIGERNYEPVDFLYRKYFKELVQLCDEMKRVRSNMIAKGYSADFSDREAELLYLLIREFKPEVVVEISPCHGYSTNYILAALTNNNFGKLYSYEIIEQINGVPIEDIIRNNLLPWIDQNRLKLVIGNVMRASIPKHDFLFIDSCHESYFAAWYLSELVDKPQCVFVHDILITRKGNPFPKAAFLGVRESYYLLQSLAMNNIFVFSVADYSLFMNNNLRCSIPTRYENQYSDRSIIFTPHQQNKSTKKMHELMSLIYKASQLVISGDRVGALYIFENVVNKENPFFIKCLAYMLLPLMGYRYHMYPQFYKELNLNLSLETVSELVAAFELSVSSLNWNFFDKLVKFSEQMRINKRVREMLCIGYKRLRFGSRSIRYFLYKGLFYFKNLLYNLND